MINRVSLIAIASLLFAFGNAIAANSLIDAGIPAPDREWSGADYRKVAEILQLGKVTLPTLADAQGRAFFERLTSTDNFAFYRNRKIPIDQRLNAALDLMGAESTLANLYVAAANRNVNVHTELVQITTFIIRTAVVVVALVDEFLPTVPKDPVRMKGLEKMKSGLTTVFVGAVQSLSETSFYSADDLSHLLGAMAETLPVLKKNFSPSYREELKKKLQDLKGGFPKAEDGKAIQGMLEQLK